MILWVTNVRIKNSRARWIIFQTFRRRLHSTKKQQMRVLTTLAAQPKEASDRGQRAEFIRWCGLINFLEDCMAVWSLKVKGPAASTLVPLLVRWLRTRYIYIYTHTHSWFTLYFSSWKNSILHLLGLSKSHKRSCNLSNASHPTKPNSIWRERVREMRWHGRRRGNALMIGSFNKIIVRENLFGPINLQNIYKL